MLVSLSEIDIMPNELIMHNVFYKLCFSILNGNDKYPNLAALFHYSISYTSISTQFFFLCCEWLISSIYHYSKSNPFFMFFTVGLARGIPACFCDELPLPTVCPNTFKNPHSQRQQ